MGKQYLQLSFSELSHLLNFYGKELDDYKLLSGGSANTNYLVVCGQEKYILTLSESKSKEELKPLVEALLYLEKCNYPTTRIFANKNREYLAEFDGIPVLLKSYIPGIVPSTLNTHQGFLLGTKISALHQLPIPDFLPSGFDYDQDHIISFISTKKSKHPFIHWLSQFMDQLEPALSITLPKSIIHADIFMDNLVVSSGEPLIIDFEEICTYSRAFDLGMAFVGVCRIDEGLDSILIKSILRGYTQHTQLNADEIEYLKPLTAFAAASTAFWRFRQFNIIEPNQGLSEHYQEMLRLADWVLEQDLDFDID